MILVLLRHGETEENRDMILQGWSQGKLTERGMKQARDAAVKLSKVKFDTIYSSDLARASDTAKEVAKFHPYTSIEFVKDLRERDLGEFTGVKASNREEHRRIAFGPNKTGESLEGLQSRVTRFVDHVASRNKDGTVLFVCHGAFIRALLNGLDRMPAGNIATMDGIGNGEIVILDLYYDAEKHKISRHRLLNFESLVR